MNETLLNQHPEQNNWQEKLEQHESKARLSGAEVGKILGSSLAESRSDYDEMFDAGTIKDHAYDEEKQKIDGALAELAQLQISTDDTESDFSSELNIQAENLKQQQESLPSAYNEEGIALAGRRAALHYLTQFYQDEIQVPQLDIRAKFSGSEFIRASREWTKQTIESHNARVENTVDETNGDSPEMQAAQERINARFAEQAKQPQPTETVDDARRKVAEVFDDTGEKERQALIGEVAQAAKGTARINTSISMKSELGFSDGSKIANADGFNSFGDGLRWGDYQWKDSKLHLEDSPEAFLFESATETRYKTVTKTVETNGRFRKKTEQVEEQIPDGEVSVMVVNPATGQQEAGVKVAYQFNSQSKYGYGDEYPVYTPPDNTRAGNYLTVEVTLPKSVADKLKKEALRSPDVARTFAERLVADNGGTEATVKMPPYTELPDGWNMVVAELQKDKQFGRVRHNVLSRQAVRVSP